ncbi:hypothetical protein [Spiroplasma endosymbiont of Zeiraphera isertana]|uniref:hypothetical protein n=1 Tax=Spiroplasma endosymbiont of Zeiraphera isertana TaxID=3066313 RepID=UPI00313DFB16
MKYFNPSYWFKLWVLSAQLFNDKTQGIDAMSIDNKNIKDWASKNTTDISLLENQELNLLNNQTYFDLQTLNQELEISTHKHHHEKNRKRTKRTTNIGVDGDNEIEFSSHFLGTNGKIYASFTPQFWEEIVYLKINNDKSKFEDKFEDKMFTGVWKDWRINSKKEMREIAKIIYENFFTIENKFIDSSRKKRIKIIIEKNYNSWKKRNEYEYKDSNIRTDDTRQYSNWYLDNLKRDFPIWDSYGTFNLELINDNNDNEIKNAIKKKYPNFIRLEEISIVDKEEYSHFCQCFKLKLYVYNMNYYSFGNLRPTFSYTTQTKLNELNDKIANDPKVIKWIKDIRDWNSTLPQTINNAKTFTPEALYNWKRNEKEILKTYIRDWSYVSTLIEHEFKIDELNKNVQGLKSSFDSIKNQVNELEKKLINLENTNKNTNNWNCANTAGIVAAVSAPIPVIGTAVSTLSGITSATCAIAGV